MLQEVKISGHKVQLALKSGVWYLQNLQQVGYMSCIQRVLNFSTLGQKKPAPASLIWRAAKPS